MKDLKFNCFHCQQDSEFKITAENRDEVRRLVSDGRRLGEVHFICTNCGFANLIEISLDTATKLLARLSSEDPETQDAINRAKKGDYSGAIDLAKKKFGIKF